MYRRWIRSCWLARAMVVAIATTLASGTGFAAEDSLDQQSADKRTLRRDRFLPLQALIGGGRAAEQTHFFLFLLIHVASAAPPLKQIDYQG